MSWSRNVFRNACLVTHLELRKKHSELRSLGNCQLYITGCSTNENFVLCEISQVVLQIDFALVGASHQVAVPMELLYWSGYDW